MFNPDALRPDTMTAINAPACVFHATIGRKKDDPLFLLALMQFSASIPLTMLQPTLPPSKSQRYLGLLYRNDVNPYRARHLRSKYMGRRQ